MFRRYKEEYDPDYVLPDTDTGSEVESTDEHEDYEEEVKLLLKEASEELTEEILGQV